MASNEEKIIYIAFNPHFYDGRGLSEISFEKTEING
jgi:hypothetical protein